MKACSKCKEEKPLTKEFYHKDKRSENGFRSDCKKCANERKKVYYKTNKERVLERNKKYRVGNKELMSEINKRYYKENKEQLLESQKEYYAENKDKIIKYQRSYYKENIDYVLSRQANYYEENKKERLEYGKKHYLENKKRIKEYRKEYRIMNRERIQKWQKEYYQNNKHVFVLHRQRYDAKKKKLPRTLTIEQWDSIKERFNNTCAYCGMTEEEHESEYQEKLHQEHFIALDKGGEYTHNNIIPSCRKCNSSKQNKDFFEWYPTNKHYSKIRQKHILDYLGYEDSAQQLSIL